MITLTSNWRPNSSVGRTFVACGCWPTDEDARVESVCVEAFDFRPLPLWGGGTCPSVAVDLDATTRPELFLPFSFDFWSSSQPSALEVAWRTEQQIALPYHHGIIISFWWAWPSWQTFANGHSVVCLLFGYYELLKRNDEWTINHVTTVDGRRCSAVESRPHKARIRPEIKVQTANQVNKVGYTSQKKFSESTEWHSNMFFLQTSNLAQHHRWSTIWESLLFMSEKL